MSLNSVVSPPIVLIVNITSSMPFPALQVLNVGVVGGTLTSLRAASVRASALWWLDDGGKNEASPFSCATAK